MVQKDENSNGLPDLSNRQIIRILMDEMVIMRNELTEEMIGMFGRLQQDVARLDKKIDGVSAELQSFRKETRLNFSTFVHNHDGHEKRIQRLEDKVGV